MQITFEASKLGLDEALLIMGLAGAGLVKVAKEAGQSPDDIRKALHQMIDGLCDSVGVAE